MKKKFVVPCVMLLILMLIPVLSTEQTHAAQSDIANQYYRAEIQYKELLDNDSFKKRRDKWMACITMFKNVYEADKDGIWAPAGLYQTGVLYWNLSKYSGWQSDIDQAIHYFRLASTYKKSRYSLRAAAKLNSIEAETTKTIKKEPPRKTAVTSPPAETGNGDLAQVNKVRFGSLPTRTRIVIDTDKAVKYRYGLLKRDPGVSKYKRLYLDIKNSTTANGLKDQIEIDDVRVADARVARYTLESVRVVVDIKQFHNYKIFSLREPNRIVVDIWGKQGDSAMDQEDPTDQETDTTIDRLITTGDLRNQFSLGVKTIVIDPGHGGQDHGAPGYFKGVYEKDIVLSIGKKLAKKIKQELKCHVVLTRDTDKYLTLEERTNLANKNRADLFISIHTNASRSSRPYGIETYFLNLAKDRDAVAVAARENATSEKNISDLQTILDSLMRNTKINESSRLAKYVQNNLYSGLKSKYSYINNKGVKQAPFYVLIGARMPSILVETSFISNKRECKRLTDATYQDHLCDAIVAGIKHYIKETEIAASY